MIQLIQDSTRTLIHQRDPLCISMFVPAQNQEILKSHFVRLWNEAWSLAEEEFSIEEMEPVFSQISLSKLLDRYEPGFDSLCLFASKKGTYLVWYDLKVGPKVVIDRSFYVKPMVAALGGHDQYWLLEVTAEDYRLSLVSLSGVEFHASARRSKKWGRVSHELRSLLRTISSDRRDWFLAGAVEHVNQARNEIKLMKSKKPPVAHLLHSDRAKLHESAREVIRIRQKHEIEQLEERIGSGPIKPVGFASFKSQDLRRSGFDTIVIDDQKDRSSLDEFSKALLPSQHQEDLLVDDLVEEALSQRFNVLAVPQLYEKIGTGVAAIKTNPVRR